MDDRLERVAIRKTHAAADSIPAGLQGGPDTQEAPAQVIDAGSLEDGQSLVVLNCLFLWDCWFLSASGDTVSFSATTNGAKSIRGPNQLAADWPTA